MADLKNVTVLIPGNAHPQTLARLGETFDLVRIERDERQPAVMAVVQPPRGPVASVLVRAPRRQVLAREFQPCLDVGKMLRHELRRIVERNTQKHPAVGFWISGSAATSSMAFTGAPAG